MKVIGVVAVIFLFITILVIGAWLQPACHAECMTVYARLIELPEYLQLIPRFRAQQSKTPEAAFVLTSATQVLCPALWLLAFSACAGQVRRDKNNRLPSKWFALALLLCSLYLIFNYFWITDGRGRYMERSSVGALAFGDAMKALGSAVGIRMFLDILRIRRKG